MTDTPRNNAAKTRGRPFKPGNPGRPKGARHKATIAAEALLDGEAEGLTGKVLEMALAGDTVAMRLCLVALKRGEEAAAELAAIPDTPQPQIADQAISSSSGDGSGRVRAKILNMAERYRDGADQISPMHP